MKRLLSFTALLLTLSGPAAVADGSPQIVDATDPERLVGIIQELGYRARLEVDGDGDPMIRSSVGPWSRMSSRKAFGGRKAAAAGRVTPRPP